MRGACGARAAPSLKYPCNPPPPQGGDCHLATVAGRRLLYKWQGGQLRGHHSLLHPLNFSSFVLQTAHSGASACVWKHGTTDPYLPPPFCIVIALP